MERITLDTVLPEIFSHQETIQSEIWQQKISFEKEKLYLVEAASGRGKALSAVTLSDTETTTTAG